MRSTGITKAFDPMDHDTPGIDLLALAGVCDLALIGNRDSNAVAVEVGSWAGMTARVLSSHFSSVYCVDHWLGSGADDRITTLAQQQGSDSAFLAFCKNMGDRLFRGVFPCRGDSVAWAKALHEARVYARLVFIDANHTYESVNQDITAWLPLVCTGGILCGHDYGNFPGVQRAVNERFRERVTVMPGGRVWYVTKIEDDSRVYRRTQVQPDDRPVPR